MYLRELEKVRHIIGPVKQIKLSKYFHSKIVIIF